MASVSIAAVALLRRALREHHPGGLAAGREGRARISPPVKLARPLPSGPRSTMSPAPVSSEPRFARGSKARSKEMSGHGSCPCKHVRLSWGAAPGTISQARLPRLTSLLGKKVSTRVWAPQKVRGKIRATKLNLLEASPTCQCDMRPFAPQSVMAWVSLPQDQLEPCLRPRVLNKYTSNT